MDMNPSDIPLEITRANQHDVKIIWKDGHESVYPAKYLRLKCPCASCVHEITGDILLDPKKVANDIRPLNISLVGRYAIQINWSDGHTTGIYAYERLRQICPCRLCQKP